MLTETRPSPDTVSNIHRRWNITRINPNSYRTSFAISLVSVAVIVFFSHAYYFGTDLAATLPYVAAGLAVVTGAKFLDHLALHGTPVNKISKVIHVSAFANLLWAATILLGIATNVIFSKAATGYVVEGLFLAAGLRIGIFTSVMGANMGRAVAVAFIQPAILFFAFVPFVSLSEAVNAVSIGFGLLIVGLGIVWALLADRSGRPAIRSTFGLLQAYISASTENKADRLEQIFEAKANDARISTRMINFQPADASQRVSIILPDVHPGPLNPVGGSDLPNLLYRSFSKNAIVMHSISDHSLNIPSRKEVERYIHELSNASHLEKGNTCSTPVQVKVGNATATGFAFGKSAVVMLSLAPKGMEDVPYSVRTSIERHSGDLGFKDILLVDCHNSMGAHLAKPDEDDLVASAKQCLDKLSTEQQHPFMIGFSNSEKISDRTRLQELAGAGVAVLVIDCDGKKYALGWADSNNMEKSLRDYIISEINRESNNEVQLIEICTSDTHSTSGKRSREGYYALGDATDRKIIADMFRRVCKDALEPVKCEFELLSAISDVKVMGQKQFDEYSFALDKSMSLTKAFTAATFVTYVVMLVFTS